MPCARPPWWPLFDELKNDPDINENARLRAKMRRLFRDEANSVADLRHDNIVSIFDYGEHEGIPYLVMDYIDGRTLYDIIQNNAPIARSKQLRFMEDLCAGLGYAHKRKLVHRDIKPANLIIDGSTDNLKILDFGVVRRLGSKGTVGVPIGTFCYMSPEQTRGAATLDHRSDIFSVGLVFYELVSGKKAFPPARNLGDLVARIQHDSPPPLGELAPNLTPGVEDIVNRALQKEPEHRYQELSRMARDIARVRSRLETEEQSDRTSIVGAGDLTIALRAPAPAPTPKPAELLVSAQAAFASGDDHAVIELCDRILDIDPENKEAVALRAGSQMRQREIKVRDLLEQADKLLVLDDLDGATAAVERAREVDAKAPPVLSFEKKLKAAAALKQMRRAERAGDVRLAYDLARTARELVPDDREASAAEKRLLVELSALDNLAAAQRLVSDGKIDQAIERLAKVRAMHPKLEDEWQALSRRRAQMIAQQTPAPPTASNAPPSQAPEELETMLLAAPSLPAPVAAEPRPALVPASVVPELPAPSPPRFDRRIIAMALAAAALLLLTLAYFVSQPDDPPAGQSAQAPALEPVAPTPPPTPEPPVATDPPTPVTVDIRPWARVRIVPATAGVEVPTEPLYTPFTIDLPPGDYSFECENGGLTKAVTYPLKVATGKPQFLVRTMPGFDAAKVVDALLAQQN